ncbi:MAG: hypothetical protein BZY80_04520 [SAR202 cluster bacterium Io17-Chloro-G2]|nr:MAG: hypothetical protein BZY80_04520 [SAR202 cluster bacterium Io17-Chloro-G2]
MASEQNKPDAVVFIPGLGKPWDGDDVQGLGDRFVTALERNQPLESSFDQTRGSRILPQPFGDTPYVKVSTNGHDLVHLYYLDLPSLLIAPYNNAGNIKKSVLLAYHILLLTPKMVTGFFNRDKELRTQIQLILWVGATMVMVLSLLILLATLATGFVALSPVGTPTDDLWAWLFPIAAAATALLGLIPGIWRSALDSATNFILAISGYVAAGAQRDVMVGRFASFVKRLAQEEGYHEVHIVSYSMGSIIALDALFPFAPPILGFNKVATLCTIGCPADVIQTYWPGYFEERHSLKGAPQHWVNIFFPSDLFASNFIAGDTRSETPREAWSRGTATRLIVGTLYLAGFRWSGLGLIQQVTGGRSGDKSESGPQPLGQDSAPVGQVNDNQGAESAQPPDDDPKDGQLRHTDRPVDDGLSGQIGGDGRQIPIHPRNFRHTLVSKTGGSGLSLATAGAHTAYWHRSDIHAAGAFDTVVQELFSYDEVAR